MVHCTKQVGRASLTSVPTDQSQDVFAGVELISFAA
jgi:hypothetical protein